LIDVLGCAAGTLVKEPIVLAHNDRVRLVPNPELLSLIWLCCCLVVQVIMGQHLFFRYVDPRELKGGDDDASKSEFDFDFAQKELSQSAMSGLLGAWCLLFYCSLARSRRAALPGVLM
jgi:hypothetical protein